MKKRKIKNPLYIDRLKNLSPRESFILGILESQKKVYDSFLNNDVTIEELESMAEAYNSFGKKLKNIDFSEDRDLANSLGWDLGVLKASEFILKNNSNKNLIQEQWFNIANKLENLEYKI